ncbi:glycosyltransferase family 4 protein [Actinopolymorpha alba]|uniref:glycosyltransferase family 4 protein n=1 Tax=Actinopolymorpha alba TaxID=533267 RepID=UPI00037492E7|nr:glycosyltransferase family 4 protein [Actinopolymorpha alba]
MHVLIAAVPYRTEHWLDLLRVLVRRPDIEITFFTASTSDRSRQALEYLAETFPHFRFHVAPRLIGEEGTGHMASVMYRPGSARVLKSRRPDVLHIIGEPAYLSTAQMLALRKRYWPDVPVTMYAAQNVVTRFPFPFPSLEQRAYDAIDCALPITPAAENVLRTKGYRGQVRLVPLGVDTELFQPVAMPLPSHPFTVGFVGWFTRYKGIGDLLAAARQIDCDLLFVGSGSLSEEIQQEAARRPGRIELHSWVDRRDLPALLARMDVLALPSVELVQRNVAPWIGIPLREQFGRVLVEAMACGVPVVGSDVGELPYVIGSAGLIFRAGNPAALATRLAQIRDDPALAQRLGAAGQTRAQLFSWSRIADSLCQTWQGLLDTRLRVGHEGMFRTTTPWGTAPAPLPIREKEGQTL